MFSFDLFSMVEGVHAPELVEPVDTVVGLRRGSASHRSNPFHNDDDLLLPGKGIPHSGLTHVQTRLGTPDSLIDDTPPSSPGVGIAHEGGLDDEGVGMKGAAAIARIAAEGHKRTGVQRPTVQLTAEQEQIEMLEKTIAHLRALPLTSEDEGARIQTKIAELEQVLQAKQQALTVEPVVTVEPLVVAKDEPIPSTEPSVTSPVTTPKKSGRFTGLRTAYATNRVWLQSAVRDQAKLAFKGNYKAQVAKIVTELRAGKAPGQILVDSGQIQDEDAYKTLIVSVYDILAKQKLRTPVMIDAAKNTDYQLFLNLNRRETPQVLKPQKPKIKPQEPKINRSKTPQAAKQQKSSLLQRQLTKRAVNIVMKDSTVLADLATLVSNGTVDARISIRLQVTQTIVAQLRSGKLPSEVVDSVVTLLTSAGVAEVEQSAIKQVVGDIFTVMKTKKLMTKKMKADENFSGAQIELWKKSLPQSSVISKGPEPIQELSSAEQFKQEGTARTREQFKANEADIEKLLGKDGEAFVNARKGRLAQAVDKNLNELATISGSIVSEWSAFVDTLGDDPKGRLRALENYLEGKGFPNGVDIVEFQRQANVLKDFRRKRFDYEALLKEIKKQIAQVHELLEKQRLADLKAKNAPQVEAYKKELDDQLQGVKTFLALAENQALLENPQYGEFKDIIDSWVYRIDFNNKLRVTLFERSLSNPHLEDQMAEDKQEVDGIEQRIRNVVEQVKALDGDMQALQELVTDNADSLADADLKQQLDAFVIKAEQARTTGLAEFSKKVDTLGANGAVEQLGEAADEIEAYKNTAEELIATQRLKTIQLRTAQRKAREEQEEKATLDAIRTKRDQIGRLISENEEALAAQPQIAEQVQKLQSMLISTANVLLGQVKVEMSDYTVAQARENFDKKFTEFTTLINEANRTYAQQKAAEAAQQAVQAAAQAAAEKEALEKAQAEAATARLKQEEVAGKKPPTGPKRAKSKPAYFASDDKWGGTSSVSRLHQDQQQPESQEPEPKESSDTLQKGLERARRGLNEVGQNLKGFWKKLTTKSGEELASASVEYTTYPTEQDRQVAVGLLGEAVSKQPTALDLGNAKDAVELLAQEVDFVKAVEKRRSFTNAVQEKTYKKAMASLWLTMASPKVNLLPEQSEKQFNANVLEAYSLLEGLNEDGEELLRRSFEFIRDGQELPRDVAQNGIKDLAVVAKTLTAQSSLYAFAKKHKGLLDAQNLGAFKDAIRALLKDKKLDELQDPMDVVLWRVLTDQGNLAQKMFSNLQLQELVTANESTVTASWAKPLLRKAFMKVSRDDQTTPSKDLMNQVVTGLNRVANPIQLKTPIDIYKLDVTSLEKFVATVGSMIEQLKDDPVMKTVWQVILGDDAALNAVFSLAQKAKQQEGAVAPAPAKGGAASSATTAKKSGFSLDSLKAKANSLAARAKEGASKLATKASAKMQELSDRLEEGAGKSE